MSKADAEIAALKETQRMLLDGQTQLRTAMEQGFRDQRAMIERGFNEERGARDRSISELRQEMQRSFRWAFSALLSILALVLGIIARLAGAW